MLAPWTSKIHKWFGLRGGLVNAAAIVVAVAPVMLMKDMTKSGMAQEALEYTYYFLFGGVFGYLVNRERDAQRKREELVRKVSRMERSSAIGELENLVERLAVLKKGKDRNIEREDLPPEILAPQGAQGPGPKTLPQAEKEMIEKALEKARGNRSQAARDLGVPRHVLLYRLKKFGID